MKKNDTVKKNDTKKVAPATKGTLKVAPKKVAVEWLEKVTGGSIALQSGHRTA